jgi:hypothetical protein
MARSRAVDFGDTGPIPGVDGEYWPQDGVAAGQRDRTRTRTRPQRSGGRPPRPGGRPPVSGIKVGVVVVLVLAVVAAVTAAALALRPTHQPGRQGGHSPSASATASAAATVLVPQQARGFQETSNGAGLAIDNRPGTAWQTQYYIGNPVFGGLKTGSGLLLDMGKAVRLSSVTIQFGPTFGADVAIEVGNDGSRTRASLATFTTVARADNLGGTHTFSSQSTATGRYVLIWFTRLPPRAHGPKNQYEAEIFNIIVKGSG